MPRTIVGLVVFGALAVAAVPAKAAKGVKYKGKTSSGHPITFVLKGKTLHDMNSGISVQCISIQGGGAPTGGSTRSATRDGSRSAAREWTSRS